MDNINNNGNAVNGDGWEATDAVIGEAYANAPDGVKKYYQAKGFVKPTDPENAKFPVLEDVYRAMTREDWDYLVKNTHTYAAGMAVMAAKRKYFTDNNGGGGTTGGGNATEKVNIEPLDAGYTPDLSPVEGYESLTAGEMLGELEDAPKPEEDAAKAAFVEDVNGALEDAGIRANVSVKFDKIDKSRVVITIEPDMEKVEDDEEKARDLIRNVRDRVKGVLSDKYKCSGVSFTDFFLGDGTDVIVNLPNGIENMADLGAFVAYEEARKALVEYPPSFFLDTKSHFRQLRNKFAKDAVFKADGYYDMESGAEVIAPEDGYFVSFNTANAETSGNAEYVNDPDFDDTVVRLMRETNSKPYCAKFGGFPLIAFYTKERDKAIAIAKEFKQFSVWNCASKEAEVGKWFDASPSAVFTR